MPRIDVDDLLDNIVQAMTDVVNTDVKLLRGYSEVKARSIARFTKLIAEGYASGEIDKEELEMELDELDGMVERFIRNMKALVNTTIERLVHAVTSTLYAAIALAATAAGVPLPAMNMTTTG
jgi:hypothetical protein